MTNPTPADFAKAVVSLDGTRDWSIVVGSLRARYEELKEQLVTADPVNFQRLQGEAQSLRKLLEQITRARDVLAQLEPTTRRPNGPSFM